MVFPNTFRILYTAIHSRGVILREADNGLEKDGEIENEAENSMWGGKVFVTGPALVVLDDDEAGQE
jgi:hypothetical protein